MTGGLAAGAGSGALTGLDSAAATTAGWGPPAAAMITGLAVFDFFSSTAIASPLMLQRTIVAEHDNCKTLIHLSSPAPPGRARRLYAGLGPPSAATAVCINDVATANSSRKRRCTSGVQLSRPVSATAERPKRHSAQSDNFRARGDNQQGPPAPRAPPGEPSLNKPRTAPPRPCRRRCTSSPPHASPRAVCPRSVRVR